MVILYNQTVPDRLVKQAEPFDKPIDAGAFVTVNASDMDLYLCGRIEPQSFQNVRVVHEFGLTPLKDRRINGVYEGELIRVHGDAHALRTNKGSDLVEGVGKEGSPVETADRVRGKGDEV